ncbi:hypothetical protein ACWDRR_43885 [Kitasatospora sp. NPDC003701]
MATLFRGVRGLLLGIVTIRASTRIPADVVRRRLDSLDHKSTAPPAGNVPAGGAVRQERFVSSR